MESTTAATMDVFDLTVTGENVAVDVPAGPRRITRGSDQQEAFWSELEDGTGNIVLNALAGSGKSSSCREGMHRLLAQDPSLVIRYTCFNKKIAEEFAVGCPAGVDAGTMHRMGHMALIDAFGSKLNKVKNYDLMDATEGGTALPRYTRRAINKLVSLAKNHGLKPGEDGLADTLLDLIARFDIQTWHKDDLVVLWSAHILGLSAEVTTHVDFDDMLWLTVVKGVRLPSCDFLFIDEAQDLSPIQHEMVAGLGGAGRVVVVGDVNQAIYGFRGAHADSIPVLRDRLDATSLPLTISWRCPESHARLVRKMVPDFLAAPEAKEGVIDFAGPDAIDRARPGDMVLCRSNAPIVAACLRQIGRRVPAAIRGRDIGKALTDVLGKLKGSQRTIAEVARALDVWQAKEVARLEARDGTEDLVEQVRDKVACLHAVAGSCDSPAEMPDVIDGLFADDNSANRITFSSVHRAKGSEASRVAYIDIPYSQKRDKFKPPADWELVQRQNLRYVAMSRSLDTLTLIS